MEETAVTRFLRRVVQQWLWTRSNTAAVPWKGGVKRCVHCNSATLQPSGAHEKCKYYYEKELDEQPGWCSRCGWEFDAKGFCECTVDGDDYVLAGYYDSEEDDLDNF